ncbi:sporulation histidine kinase inhibitor Sda [Salinibacillus xinjiangensis]|uniref:Sporulation histidine kinase inhibitor Sda n=1 Tax=Salinibacillus xinjiangensis TaxID=1229268 RepID=A0A6G1X7K3_9BACI|nr:sporulation histidine kinase inhibitor Sda [Salinibacillus xinjiangensis]MRG86885.1 sporulation histidine kinase inhibitor Sda [Salinibacillus xinjiangensis]
MYYLTNDLLIEVYQKAILLECEEDFIKLLEDEISKRGIRLEDWLKDRD